jgi:hypothetical protein
MKINEAISEMKRELSMRKKVYPDWIRFGKIDKKTAEQRTEIIEWIIKNLESQITKQEKLF